MGSIMFRNPSIDPLRDRVNRYRHEKMSEVVWKKVKNILAPKVKRIYIESCNNQSPYETWLELNPKADWLVIEISKDMEKHKEHYDE